MSDPVWSYGITTCPERWGLFESTLTSLEKSGFGQPHVFMDGPPDLPLPTERVPRCTVRSPRVFTTKDRNDRPCGSSAGPWALALYELYLRNPWADRYALFQDDCVACRHLKDYLDRIPLTPRTYWNLFTFTSNYRIGAGRSGFYPSNQHGRGAVGLVFDRLGVVDLLSSREWAERPQDRGRGHKAVDGGIQNTLVVRCGYTELVHNPSLLQHTGERSSIGNLPHAPSPCFAGEDFDARSLLEPR